jgi:amidase
MQNPAATVAPSRADDDPLGAFVPGARVHVAGAPSGPLSGVRFAAKDLFDVAGEVTGGGNPDWARTHPPAVKHAAAVEALLAAGAELVGKTITDELAYSLNGQNHHYGTPVNSAAPGRIPGGSSSGSASAVAGGVVDTALGSDTGGSIRIPASYCGLFGLRPTHGRISLAGVMPLAPSFDTCGWFARDATMLRRVGEVLLGAVGDARPGDVGSTELLLAEDALELVGDSVREALAPAVERLTRRFGAARRVRATTGKWTFEALTEAFRTIQAREITEQHSAWIAEVRPTFGADVAERFAWAATITAESARAASEVRGAFRQHFTELLAGDRVLCLPTAPGIAPLASASAEALAEHRPRALALTSLCGLSGFPQITLPLARLDGCPLGISLIASPGSDQKLLALAEVVTRG